MIKKPSLKRKGSAGSAEKSSRSRKTSFIFFVGDEGGVLVYLQGNTVLRRVFCPTVDIQNSKIVSEVIGSDPKAPIYMLVDMMDQSYVKQTLPPVTKLSVQKLIKRRLERDFSPEDVKGALPLGREKEGRKDWNYLLISLANSPQLIGWMELVLEFDNPFKGIYLAPVEAESLIRQLAKKLRPESNSQWQLLVTNNKVGGFRQVIVKDGRLTFTRLAQAVGDNSPEVMAGNIEQEVLNTIEYLKRLSYQEGAGLEIYIIASEGINNAIDAGKLKATHVELLTPYRASEALDLDQAALPEDHYADVVFSSFFGKTTKKILKLHTRISQKLETLYQARRSAIALTAIVALACCGLAVMDMVASLPLQKEVTAIERKRDSSRAKIKSLQNKTRLLPADLDRITDVVSIYEIFQDKKHFPLTFIRDIIGILPSDIVVRSFDWSSPGSLERRFGQEEELVQINVSVEFLNNKGPVDTFQKSSQEFFDAITAKFPQYTFSHSPLPGIIEKNEAFQTSFSDSSRSASTLYLDGAPIVVTLQFKNEDTKAKDKTARRGRR